jgi:glycosyltransferase involved in cell wall biosynthesis
MRILICTDTYIPEINGVTKTLGKLRDYLSENAIKYRFFAPGYPKKMGSSKTENTIRFKSFSFPLYSQVRVAYPWYEKFKREADNFKPDIIHLATPAGIGLAGHRYARKRNIPIITSFHTNFDEYLKYYHLNFIYDKVWDYFRWFHRPAVINFSPSMDTLRKLEDNGIGNLKIWSKGINRDIFNPDFRNETLREELGLKDKITFVYIGRIAREKSLDIFLHAIKKLNTISSSDKIRFLIVGDGPYLKTMMKESPSNVLFTGFKTGRELSELYAAGDVFVFPSGSETFGNVVYEAFASGLPVIAVNSGGVKDLVVHGENGLMSIPKDAVSLAYNMKEFIDHPELVKKLRKNALMQVKGKTWDAVMKKYIEDCKSVLDENVDRKKKKKTA